jgi:ribosomal-protein-alanine N-acetyltransferase
VNEPIELTTERLLLRSFTMEDAVALTDLAGTFEIADTMISIPHPFPPEFAREWITSAGPAAFAVCELTTDTLAGCAELRDIEVDHAQAELSFWIGRPFWGRGYASEAVAALVRHGFDSLGLNRIYAHHMCRNPASGRVLQNLGMQQEGLLRQRVRKWGRFEDVCLYAILRSDTA